jgi:hypothetical protein
MPGRSMHLAFDYVLGRKREEVWKAFDNPDNMKKWQPTLAAFEPMVGTPGQEGAVSKLTYREDGRQIVLMETITIRREPEEYGGTYESDMATSVIHNRFEPDGPWTTRWNITIDFRFRGLWRLLGPLFKGAIARRTRADLERFKILLESGQL